MATYRYSTSSTTTHGSTSNANRTRTVTWPSTASKWWHSTHPSPNPIWCRSKYLKVQFRRLLTVSSSTCNRWGSWASAETGWLLYHPKSSGYDLLSRPFVPLMLKRRFRATPVKASTCLSNLWGSWSLITIKYSKSSPISSNTSPIWKS